MEENNISYVCFASYNDENISKLYEYLFNNCNIKCIQSGMDLESELSFIVIYDLRYYYDVIKKGNKFLGKNKVKDVFWFDNVGNIIESDLTYLGLFNLCNKKGNVFWGIDEKLPKDIKNYLSCLKKHIDPKGTIIQRYEEDKCGGYLVLMSKDINKYEEYQYKMQEFFEENGFGPFVSFETLNEVGAMVDDTKYLSKTLKKGK